MQRKMMNLRTRHPKNRLRPRQDALNTSAARRQPIMQLGDAHIPRESFVCTHRSIHALDLKAELVQHIKHPRTVGTEQPVAKEMEPILKMIFARVDVRDQVGVHGKEEPLDPFCSHDALALRRRRVWIATLRQDGQ
jgi:hypothetical protein